MSKRRRGYPSETSVGRGERVVHGNKELCEKLGRNDLCPCGSGRRFQGVLPEQWTLGGFRAALLLLGSEKTSAVIVIANAVAFTSSRCTGIL